MERRARDRIETPCPLHPALAGGLPPCADLAPLRDDVFWKLERFVWPAQRNACLCDLLGTERRTVGFFGALAVRCAETDDRAARDQRRTVIVSGLLDRGRDRFGIVPIDAAGRPARCLE